MRCIWNWLPVLAVPLLLAGCGNDGQQQHDKGKLPAAEASQGPENQSMSSSDSDASPAESGQELNSAKPSAESSVDYTREIAFDIDAIQDPLVNEEIKTSLRDALEGIVNEDQEQFNRAFTTAELAKVNGNGFITGGGITFTGVDYISEQSSGRVVMNVNYTRKTEDGEQTYSPNYWFMQNKEGIWGLVTID